MRRVAITEACEAMGIEDNRNFNKAAIIELNEKFDPLYIVRQNDGKWYSVTGNKDFLGSLEDVIEFSMSYYIGHAEEIADEAIYELANAAQKACKQYAGDFAGIYFSGDSMRENMVQYVLAEWSNKVREILMPVLRDSFGAFFIGADEYYYLDSIFDVDKMVVTNDSCKLYFNTYEAAKEGYDKFNDSELTEFYNCLYEPRSFTLYFSKPSRM